jgi:hypothetical protein
MFVCTSPSIDAIGGSVAAAHRRRRRRCPEELTGQFGPQLTALIAYLTVVCRLPRLVVQRLLEGALQIPMSLTGWTWRRKFCSSPSNPSAMKDSRFSLGLNRLGLT